MNFTHLTKSQRQAYNALLAMDWDVHPDAIIEGQIVQADIEMHGRFGHKMTETVTITATGPIKRKIWCECNRDCAVVIDDPEEIHTKIVWVNGVLQRHKGFLNWRRAYGPDRDGMSVRTLVRWAQARTLVSKGGTKVTHEERIA